MDWTSKLINKRKSLHSTVGLVKTNDPTRTRHLIGDLAKVKRKAKGKRKDIEVLHFDHVHNLREVDYGYIAGDKIENLKKETIRKLREDGHEVGYKFNDVSINSGDDLFQGMNNPIKDIIEIMHTKKETFLIIEDTVSEELYKYIKTLAHDDHMINNFNYIVFISNDVDSIPQDVKDKCIYVKPPVSTERERRGLLQEAKQKLEMKQELDQSIINATAGLNLNELQAIFSESYRIHNEIKLSIVDKYKRDKIERTGLISVMNPLENGFDSIGGYDVLKETAKDEVIFPIQNPEIANQFGNQQITKGILLFGDGGNGKTLFVRALAQELGLLPLELHTDNIFSKYVGESAQNLRDILDLIEAFSPCLVFIDEFGSIGMRNQGMGDGGTRRDVFDNLLSWMGNEDREAIVCGTTNTISQIDKNMLRAGRFDLRLYQPYPDVEARMEIFKVHIRRKNVPTNNVDLEFLAHETENYSGAEIELIVKNASKIATKRYVNDKRTKKQVTQDDFEKALDNFSIDESKRKDSIEQYRKEAQEYSTDQRFLNKLIDHQEEIKGKFELVKEST